MLIPAVDEAKKTPLDHRTYCSKNKPRSQERKQRQKGRPSHGKKIPYEDDAKICAQGVKTSAGQVKDLLNPEDQLKARGHQKQDCRVEKAAEKYIDDGFQLNSPKKCAKVRRLAAS